MYKNLEKDLRVILDLVKQCPTNLQEKCFEILLTNLVARPSDTKKGTADIKPIGNEKELSNASTSPVEETNKQEEIKSSDLHVKAKKLIEQGLSLAEINNLFYLEDDELKPIFDDLKSTKIVESQIKIALLEALKSGIKTGDFKFDTKVVKQQCELYKCYDKTNFASNFKSKADLFNEDYVTGGTMSLTAKGKAELIKISKDLAI